MKLRLYEGFPNVANPVTNLNPQTLNEVLENPFCIVRSSLEVLESWGSLLEALHRALIGVS